MASFLETLPPVYRGLLPAVFDEPAPPEPRASCDHCAMCEGGEHQAVTFLPSTKCCTFSPQLPNYLAGALLADPDPALDTGRARLRAHIAERSRITPRWAAPSRKKQVLYRAARFEVFGRSEALLCRFYDEGRCSIWRYREASCSSFFCKHERGGDSREMWRAMRDYLDLVERALTSHFVKKIAPELKDPEPPMTLEELEGRPPHPADYTRWWGKWEGREEEFYLRCAELMQGLTRADVQRLAPIAHKRRLPFFQKTVASIASDTLPATLMLAPDLIVERLPDERVRVSSYSEYDPLLLDAATFAALDAFRQPAPHDAVPWLDRELLLRLERWRVLIPPPIDPELPEPLD
jgi:Fe-S-cluster containining protein